MENSASKKGKAKTDKKEKIREAYIDYLLEHGEEPTSVYKFMKMLKMSVFLKLQFCKVNLIK